MDEDSDRTDEESESVDEDDEQQGSVCSVRLSQQELRMLVFLYITYFFYYFPRKADDVVKHALERDEGFSLSQLGFNDACCVRYIFN